MSGLYTHDLRHESYERHVFHIRHEAKISSNKTTIVSPHTFNPCIQDNILGDGVTCLLRIKSFIVSESAHLAEICMGVSPRRPSNTRRNACKQKGKPSEIELFVSDRIM